jgi:predicted dehydrogenase
MPTASTDPLHHLAHITAPPLPGSLRIAVVGARTRHQGIGEHVARHFAEMGHQITAVAGSSSESAHEACQHLQGAYGIVARGYASVEALLASETLDAIAICSPDRFHRQHLATALAHPVHILCEKPLVFEPQRDPAADAAPLVEASRLRRSVLMVNEQWPYTLSSFAAVYPQFDFSTQAPRTISMWLSPSVTGAAMIPNAVPHLLSLVWRLCPAGGDLEQVSLRSPDGEGKELDIEFDYRHRWGVTHVALELRQAIAQPRPAGYAIDGHRVRRVVEMSPYELFLEADDHPSQASETGLPARRVRMPDPLALLAADFANRVLQCASGAAAWHDVTILERQRALGKIARAARDYFASCGQRSTDELT